MEKIAIGIIAKNEAGHIGDTIDRLDVLTYPKELIHLVLVDGNSTDSTVHEFSTACEQHDFSYEVLHENDFSNDHGWSYGHSRARNIIVSYVSDGGWKYLARLDADCRVDELRLTSLYEKISSSDSSVAAVGGSRYVETQGVSDRELYFNYYISHPLISLGNAAFSETEVTTMRSVPGYNSLFKVSLLKQFTYETGYPFFTDDNSMSYFMTQKGYRFLYVRDAKIYHKMVDTLSDFRTMMFNYGTGVMFMSMKYRTIYRIYIWIALGFLMYPVSVPVLSGMTGRSSMILLSIPYVFLLLFGGYLRVQIRRKIASTPSIHLITLPIQHLWWYGAGCLRMILYYHDVKYDGEN